VEDAVEVRRVCFLRRMVSSGAVSPGSLEPEASTLMGVEEDKVGEGRGGGIVLDADADDFAAVVDLKVRLLLDIWID